MAARGAIIDPTCEGTLTIGGVLLNTPAWTVSDLFRLWGTQIDYRGTDRVLPYSQGVVAYPRWKNGLRVSLPTIITGHVNSAGVAAVNPMSQLAANIETLRAVVVAPDPTTTVTRTISVLKPNGVTYTGTCVPLGLTPGSVTLSVMRATLELLIPAGSLV